jgi:type I restriction enzyme S subunit
MVSPVNTKQIPLAECAEVVSGVAKGRRISGTTVETAYLRVANVQAGYLDLGEIKTIPASKAEIEKYRLQPDDVVLTEGGDYDKLGRGALWTGAVSDCIHQNHVFRVRLDKTKVLPRYFAYYLQTTAARDYFLKCAKKTTNLASINMTQLRALPVPLPNLKEQSRIVARLSCIESITQMQRKSLTLLERLINSLFARSFGDPMVAPNKEWLRTLGSVTDGKPNNGLFRKNDDYGSGLPVVWVEELFHGRTIDTDGCRQIEVTEAENRKYALTKGDILFCRSSLRMAGVGYNNLYDGETGKALFECHLIRISPNQNVINPHFLNFQLRLPSMRHQVITLSNTVTMSTIGQDAISRIKIIVPPIKLQNEFVNLLRKVQELEQFYALSIEKSARLFQSTLDSVFLSEAGNV